VFGQCTTQQRAEEDAAQRQNENRTTSLRLFFETRRQIEKA